MLISNVCKLGCYAVRESPLLCVHVRVCVCLCVYGHV